VAPIRAGQENNVAREDWENAARQAGNLSELHLTLGRVGEAIAFAERSVEYADRSGDAPARIFTRAWLADAFHQAGRLDEAEKRFHEGEAMQRQRQPQYPLLYSVRGYRYCDLLLTRRRHEEVLHRATQTLEWVRPQNWLLGIGLDHVSLARAALLAAQSGRNEALDQARSHAQAAVDTLRRAGEQEFVARALLARAEVHRFGGDCDAARRDLDEAMAIATRDPAGHMKLHETDCHLGYARLALDEGNRDAAREHLALAESLIHETGYHRRDPDLAALKPK
jgi:tetratricopeptide (TPR) repeat protein